MWVRLPGLLVVAIDWVTCTEPLPEVQVGSAATTTTSAPSTTVTSARLRRPSPPPTNTADTSAGASTRADRKAQMPNATPRALTPPATIKANGITPLPGDRIQRSWSTTSAPRARISPSDVTSLIDPNSS